MNIFGNNNKKDFQKELEYLLASFTKNRDYNFEESLIIDNKEGKKRRQYLVGFYNTWINIISSMLTNPYYLENLPDIIWFSNKDEFTPSSENVAKFRDKMYDVALHAKKKIPSARKEINPEDIGNTFTAMSKLRPQPMETNVDMELDKSKEIDPTKLKDMFKES